MNNNRSLLHVFTGAASAPNITGGYFGNTVAGTGGVIAGGGQAGGVNTVSAAYGAMVGGSANTISPFADHSFIGGGSSQAIDANSEYGVIGGGQRNNIRGVSRAGTIGGGAMNVIGPNL